MLNLAFGGRIYESGPDWEDCFTNLVETEKLTFEALLTEHLHLEITRIPARASTTPPEHIDLTHYYTRPLQGSRDWAAENSRIEWPVDHAVLGGVAFDARGVVQLGSRNFAMMHRAAAISNVIVGLACRSLVFLHGTINEETEGTVVGQYVIRFANGATELLPVSYGRDVADWQTDPESVRSLQLSPGRTAAWPLAGRSRTNWLYTTRWSNPHPDIPISKLDFVGSMTESSPFLVAITAEKVQPSAPAALQAEDKTLTRSSE
jgi:hypothetical protein